MACAPSESVDLHERSLAQQQQLQHCIADRLWMEMSTAIEEQHLRLLSQVKMSCRALGMVHGAREGPHILRSKQQSPGAELGHTDDSKRLPASEASLMQLEQRLIHIQAQMSRLEQHVLAMSLEGTGRRSLSGMADSLEGQQKSFSKIVEMEKIAVDVAAPEAPPIDQYEDLDMVFPGTDAVVVHDKKVARLEEDSRLQRSKSSLSRSISSVMSDVDDDVSRPTWAERLMARCKRGMDYIKNTKRTRLEVIVTGPRFDIFFAAMIVVNAMVMALELQYSGYDVGLALRLPRYDRSAEDQMPGIKFLLQNAEVFFTIVFAVELVLRVVGLRLKFILSLWNWMDVFIVTAAMFDLIGLSFLVNASALRLVRLTKLIRLLKMIKAASQFGHFFLLMTSLRSSGSILFWSLFIICTIQTIIGTIMSQILRGFIEDTSISEDVRRQLFLYWGTFLRTTITMFHVTLGDSVSPYQLLVDEVHEGLGLIFMVYKCVVGFGWLSVISAVFVQHTHDTAKENETIALKQAAHKASNIQQKLQQLFSAMDSSGDGLVSREEFKSLMSNPRVHLWLEHLQVDSSDLDKLFDFLDDGDGNIEAKEFINGLQDMKGQASRMDVVHLRKLIMQINSRDGPKA
eukprot:gnl/TRDRNA2_/TRDRNA2_171228_c0_seq2.p1 gnl/TRDRNA2_/TRDRNA2_171228_c0~~gnl/TRDRNA2_/TRDRNA2_171228_c0_seq2.p1  ORF type:complete len:628 (+),score=89.59 gnl/TRDRNA2_/TRDRNA2_171228_c0_seq2:61-1944(+)